MPLRVYPHSSQQLFQVACDGCGQTGEAHMSAESARHEFHWHPPVTSREDGTFLCSVCEELRVSPQDEFATTQQTVQRIVAASDQSTLMRRVEILQRATSMVTPLRGVLNYQSIARSVMPIQQLPAGALPVYDRDPDVVDALAIGLWQSRVPQELPDWVTPGALLKSRIPDHGPIRLLNNGVHARVLRIEELSMVLVANDEEGTWDRRAAVPFDKLFQQVPLVTRYEVLLGE